MKQPNMYTFVFWETQFRWVWNAPEKTNDKSKGMDQYQIRCLEAIKSALSIKNEEEFRKWYVKETNIQPLHFMIVSVSQSMFKWGGQVKKVREKTAIPEYLIFEDPELKQFKKEWEEAMKLPQKPFVLEKIKELNIWQTCPVCSGFGQIKGSFDTQYGWTQLGSTKCRVCNGKGIISQQTGLPPQ